jgi:hypothetical protein
MKLHHHLFRSFLILSFVLFITSCSSDEIVVSEENSTLTQRQNLVNPFEKIGVVYKQIYDAYQFNSGDSLLSIQQIILEVEKAAAQVPDFVALQNSYTPIDTLVIGSIVFDQTITVKDYIRDSTLSSHAQQLFISLADALHQNTTSNSLNLIIDFEESIIQDTHLTLLDKEIMLTSCSIMRYNLDNGDTDWNDDNNGIIKSALIGMQEHTTKAIIMAVVVQVAVQHQVAIDL